MKDEDQAAATAKPEDAQQTEKPQRTLKDIDERLAAVRAAKASEGIGLRQLTARFAGNAKVAAKRMDALATMHCNIAVAFMIAGLIANFAVGGPGSAGLLLVSLFNALAHILSGMVWLGLQEET